LVAVDLDRARRMLSRSGSVARGWARYAAGSPLSSLGDFRAWAWTTFVDGDLVAAGLPWTTFAARRWLDRFLRPEMRVFEWGGGGSTVYFARRVREVISVEHQADWYHEVARRLREAGVGNTQLRLIVPQDLPPDGWSPRDLASPLNRSSDPRFLGKHFTAYVESINDQPDESLDVVLVDGRCRATCAAAARAKVRPGGALIVDDSDRIDTASAVEALEREGWLPVHLCGPGPASVWPAFWRTSVFLKRGSPQRRRSGP
jgi:hypothetical protein